MAAATAGLWRSYATPVPSTFGTGSNAVMQGHLCNVVPSMMGYPGVLPLQQPGGILALQNLQAGLLAGGATGAVPTVGNPGIMSQANGHGKNVPSTIRVTVDLNQVSLAGKITDIDLWEIP